MKLFVVVVIYCGVNWVVECVKVNCIKVGVKFVIKVDFKMVFIYVFCKIDLNIGKYEMWG